MNKKSTTGLEYQISNVKRFALKLTVVRQFIFILQRKRHIYFQGTHKIEYEADTSRYFEFFYLHCIFFSHFPWLYRLLLFF